MGRKPMIEYSEGVYHLIQRGNNRGFIFERKEDKEYLLELIRDFQRSMGFECYGYVIMGNHYHLIIKRYEVPIKDIMHRINNQFSRYYNQKNKRTGHVFENRYRGYHVMDDRYLLSLLRYIHQNPVCAGICQRVSDYVWSSDQFYRKNTLWELVNIDFILGIFSADRKNALKAYCDFMDEKILEDERIFEGSDRVENKEKNTSPIKTVTAKKMTKKTLDELLKEITQDDEIYDAIKSGSRKRTLSSYKKEFIQMALKENYTMRAIGESLSVSEVAIYKMVSKNQ
ncbi:MAG: hypothetical protein CVV00_12845 [Firmicutes bacterium HGW-Firmicutes-5]|nr:MAG: hypothetical protein CVV00_12845 [Firmicutes bacterium HGW-Firmicutes-5]